MRGQFKKTVTELAANDDRAVVILGDVSVYQFKEFQERHPSRFYNMGICENALISVTAGLSARGLHPFVHTIAPFLTERCVEQIKLDMCYNNFGGNIVTCGASFDYAWDGATHHAYMDLAILRMLPGMEVIQPGSEAELDSMLRSQWDNGKPTYFRLSDHPHTIPTETTFGKGTVIKDAGSRVTVVTAGPLLKNVIEGCAELDANILYFHTLKPLDRALLEKFRDTKILVVHDAYGLREAIGEAGIATQYLGLRDEFCGSYGTVHDVRAQLGLDPAGIRHFVQSHL